MPTRTLTAVGTMSGTSLDGVDVALLETDGETVAQVGPTFYRSYSTAERALLRSALAEAQALTDRRARPGRLAEAERLVTDVHAAAITAFMAQERIASADVVGFHGQTVLHRPAARLTVQIGDGPMLASKLGIPVVYDFRAADMEAGGEGAPLAPAFHRALVRGSELPRPVAVLNLGGVGNLTFLDGDAEPIAFDTGPANAPIDDLVRARTGADYDDNGRLAAAGRADESVIARVLAHPYFAAKPPKSLDRAEFARLPLDALGTEDAAATATAIVAASVARAIDHLPKAPAKVPATWIVTGGGARNPTLMAMLRARLPGTVQTADEAGWNADAIEAQAFAFLAVRSLNRLALTFPGTTGVTRPITGGVLANP
jgi:anhydro-N-acetylmuramic acid kinase